MLSDITMQDIAAVYTTLRGITTDDGGTQQRMVGPHLTLALDVTGDATEVTLWREGYPISALLGNMFLVGCLIPKNAERVPAEGQHHNDADWYGVGFRWPRPHLVPPQEHSIFTWQQLRRGELLDAFDALAQEAGKSWLLTPICSYSNEQLIAEIQQMRRLLTPEPVTPDLIGA